MRLWRGAREAGKLLGRWGPVFVWMAGIFYFSSQPAPLDAIAPGPSGPPSILGIMIHLVEYLGLVLLLYRALSAHPRSALERSSPGSWIGGFWASPALALGYAILDELHQNAVPGRSFEAGDIGYDLGGIAGGSVLVWVWSKALR